MRQSVIYLRRTLVAILEQTSIPSSSTPNYGLPSYTTVDALLEYWYPRRKYINRDSRNVERNDIHDKR